MLPGSDHRCRAGEAQMSDDARSRRAGAVSRRAPSPARRHLLRGAAATAAATGLSALGCAPPWPQGGSAPVIGRRGDFIVHDPTDWETRPATLDGSPITPHGELYVCNHLPFPEPDIVADPSRWRLDVRGTRRPGTFSLDALRALGTESVTMVLQCTGNGRRFFAHRSDGPDWGIGAVGCVTWTGVPLRRVAAAAGGVEALARYATATGGEAVNPLADALFSMRVERSIPLDKALDDCLLALEMNGAPIPLVHGGPLRLVVPGYFGINQVKYLKVLAFGARQSDADMMRHEYRYRPVGVAGAVTQPTAWAMGVKSIVWPAAPSRVRRGAVLHGVAFGGLEPVERVEISWNGGADWRAARFTGPDLGRYAWRCFDVPVDVPPGTHTVASRAVDAAGRCQPERRTPNAGGYGNASWRDHAVRIEVA